MSRRYLLFKKQPTFDISILITVLLLALYGTMMVFSAGYAYAHAKYGDATFFMRKQVVWLLLGVILMLTASRVSPSFFKKATPYLYGITIFLLVLVLVVGFVGNGAKRWISIGPLTIQPSEIAKLTMLMMLSYYFSEFEEKALSDKKKYIFSHGTLLPGIIMLIPILLVMLQKHLSCIVILGALGLIMIVISGADLRYISAFCLAGITGISALALFTDYTRERITVWRNPEAYKLTGGWQTLQGLMAIGSGGIFGTGYTKGVMKHCYVSEPANDMIFAILCEELGLIGALIAILLFAVLTVRAIKVSLRADGVFERLLAFGIAAKLALQALLNIAVVTNSVPNTGISLPFFSYGGSSLIMIFVEMGMLLSISRYAKILK